MAYIYNFFPIVEQISTRNRKSVGQSAIPNTNHPMKRYLPLLSIIIATRNRYQYCVEVIDLILSYLTVDAELVIQDNSDTNTLADVVLSKQDSRIRYSYEPKPLSFVENFSKAVEKSNGMYICLLGDDDTVTKDINDVVSWMYKNNIESVTPKQNVDYIWPNTVIEEYNTGQLTIPVFTGSVYKLDVELQLKKLLKAGVINYQRFGLPRIYHGIVSKAALNEVKNRTGHFFGGLTPDIYATISLSCVIENHYVVDFPFTIAGACPASASVISRVGGHSGELSTAPHLKHRGKYEWNPLIPSYYSVETIWAETSLKALSEMGRKDLITLFAPYKFMYYSMFANRNFIFGLTFRKTFLKYKHSIPAASFHTLRLLLYLPAFVVQKTVDVIKNRLLPKTAVKQLLIQRNILSLTEAQEKTQSCLINIKPELKNIITTS